MQLEPELHSIKLPAPPVRRLSLGVIGLGWAAQNCHLPSLRILKEEGWPLRIAALCDQLAEKSQAVRVDWPEAAIENDPQKLLDRDDLDGVLILTHPDSSARLLRAAIARRKTIFVEKPVAHTRQEVEACAVAAAAHGLRVQVGYNRRHQPLAADFRKRLNEMSGPRHVKVQFWRAGRGEPGFFDDTLVHCLDFLSHMLGRLQVHNVRVWPVTTDPVSLDLGWRIDLVAESDSMITAEIDIRPSVGQEIETYQALGKKLSLMLQYPHPGTVDGQVALVVYDDGREHIVRQERLPTQDSSRRCIHSGFVNQIAEFVHLCADDGVKPSCGLYDALDVLRLRDDIASLRTGLPAS